MAGYQTASERHLSVSEVGGLIIEPVHVSLFGLFTHTVIIISYSA